MRHFKPPIRARLLAARVFERGAGVRSLRRQVQRLVADDDVVEVGCGFGFNARLCRGGYLGVDLDTEMVRVARRLNPGREFLPGGPAIVSGRFATGLLSLTLHEANDRTAILRAMGALCPRLVICDYDPRMRLVRRLATSLMEEEVIGSYWGFDLQSTLDEFGWTLTGTGPIGTEYRWWEYRCGAPPPRLV